MIFPIKTASVCTRFVGHKFMKYFTVSYSDRLWKRRKKKLIHDIKSITFMSLIWKRSSKSICWNESQGIKQGFGNTQAAMLQRHEWNLIKEMIVLVFFDPWVPFRMLELMMFMLHSFDKPNPYPLGKLDFNPVFRYLNKPSPILDLSIFNRPNS